MGLLEKLKAGVKNTRTIPFLGESITIRVLSESELQQCRSLAEKDRVKLGLDDESIMVENVLRQLHKACSDGEGKPVADTFDSFKECLSRSEREYLVEEYLDLSAECSPRAETMTDAEYAKLEGEVKKNPQLILSSSSTGLLKKLVRYLECRPRI